MEFAEDSPEQVHVAIKQNRKYKRSEFYMLICAQTKEISAVNGKANQKKNCTDYWKGFKVISHLKNINW